MLVYRTLLLSAVLLQIGLAADAHRGNFLVLTKDAVDVTSVDSKLRIKNGQTVLLSAQEIILEETWELNSAKNITIQGNAKERKTIIVCPDSGSAIAIGVTGITIRNVIFTNCTSSAVHLLDLRDADDPIHADFDDVDFLGNDVSHDHNQKGAAISIGSRCTANVAASTFFQNRAHMGGAIFVGREANLNIKNSFFKHNVAMTNGGGAIFAYGSVMVEDCHFLGCESLGMFDGNEPTTQLGRPLEALASHVFPTPGSGGGAIMLVDAPEAQIIESLFDGNMGASGGAICSRYRPRRQSSVPKKVFNIQKCVFKDNKAISSGATMFFNRDIFQGGAVYFSAAQDGVRPSIEACQFTDNHARFGGALHILTTENTLFKLHGSHFKSNSAEVAGGAVLLRNTGNVDWAANSVVENHARVGGGLFSTNNAFLTITGVPRKRDGEPLTESFSIFKENSAEIGGGMACVACGATTMQDPIFIDNRATRHGGGLSVEDAVSDFFIQQVQARGNKALKGGGIYVDSAAGFRISAVPKTKSVFEKNVAVEGGGLHISQAHRQTNMLQVREVQFLENSAVSVSEMVEELSDVAAGESLGGKGFEYAEGQTWGCKQGGGGMCLIVNDLPQPSSADVLLSELKFERNIAPVAGGLFIAISGDKWRIQSCPFNPELGAGPCRGIRIVGADFVDNFATIRDPALSVSDESVVFVTCQTFFEAVERPKTLQDVLTLEPGASKEARQCITLEGNELGGR
ncbi:hypothetical protein BSKO_10635 [Bryopsis sp. KO-2023]|nr:hypothetical protein BSKO_10635 [Bryopsis sp. KO-2023]